MATPRFYCHTCKKDIVPLEELTCPTCKGDFVEEVEEDNPPPVPQATQPQPQPQPQQQQQQFPFPPPGQPLLPFAQLVHQMLRMNNNNPNNNSNNNNPFGFPLNFNINTNTTNNTSTNNNPNPQPRTTSFTFQAGPGGPFPLFQTFQHNNTQQNPLNILEFFNNMPGVNIFGGVPLAGNPGDYVFGNNLEQIMNQLFQNANHTGNPPAAKSAIDELNKGLTNESHVENKADCAICKEEFPLGSEYIEMPCKHIFDKECILQWLAIHNSCPGNTNCTTINPILI